MTDAHRRRAISTAYYALYHLVLNAGAQRFVGGDSANRGAFAMVYWGYNHADMTRACQEIAKPTLKQSLQIQLGHRAMGQAAREFAEDFVSIHELRHLADYDPNAVFDRSELTDLIDTVEYAMASFAAIAPAEKADVLALILVKSRS